MCSFLIFHYKVDNLDYLNYFLKKRGPDLTYRYDLNGCVFIHNLLHLTGKMTKQPFVDKENEIVCLYNGEIYNYKEFGEYESDGCCLIDLYKKYSIEFIKKLDGEFAIVLFDFKKNIFIIATDVFGTKPLWISTSNGRLGISSYKSGLDRAGLSKNAKKIAANTILTYDLGYLELMEEDRVYEFDFYQYKTTYDDWASAFINSIKKRVDNENYPVFVCLSSGYDSGCICTALNIIGKEFYTYTIMAKENKKIVNDRIKINNKVYCKESNVIELTRKEYEELHKYIKKSAEFCKYEEANGKTDIFQDSASVGMAKICKLASEKKRRIYLSGTGADEIHCDYGINGKKIYGHSCFGGKYPNNLYSIVSNDPDEEVIWKSFFNGTQKDYLGKEENISGCFGIEGRYPFLDKELVQEFLWLHPKLKNANYKAPLEFLLKRYNYPYDKDVKIGFSANVNLK